VDRSDVPAYEPNTTLIANGLAGMGFAVPAAIAAKLVNPSTSVVAVSGDGGFVMNAQELETAKRLKTAFVNVIWENNQFGSIEWKQRRRFGRSFGVDFTNPDFVALAAAYGLPGWRIGRADEFSERLAHALTLDVRASSSCPSTTASTWPSPPAWATRWWRPDRRQSRSTDGTAPEERPRARR